MMAETNPGHKDYPVAWLQGGAALSLGGMAWAVSHRRWLAARLFFHLAAAFLGKWGELRLQARVRALLAKTGTWDGTGDPPFDFVDSWRTA